MKTETIKSCSHCDNSLYIGAPSERKENGHEAETEPCPPIKLDCKWTDLFGPAIPENKHRKNWEKWKRIARNAGEQDLVDYWTDDTEACRGCKHLDRDWCIRAALPCTVNPYLTLRRGLGVGVACMGMGYDEFVKQEEFDFG
jgi:hypothetical protein